MLNRLFSSTSASARQKAGQSAVWSVFARDTASGFITTAHHMLLAFGIAAICTLAVMFFKPDFADRVMAFSPFADKIDTKQYDDFADAKSPSPTARVSDEDEKLVGTSRQQQWVTQWLAKRYRVATDATNMLVSASYMTAREIKLDPLLILSVMAIESGLNPFAESPVGAQGLMQVMSKVHHDKFQDLGGVKAALNPVANIRVGSLILKDYVTRGGSVEAGLKLYVGAGAFETDSGYGAKVLAEYQRLKDVASGKKVSIYATSASSAQPKAKPQESKLEEASAEQETLGKSGKEVAML